jgi:rod shape-determining protein MreC
MKSPASGGRSYARRAHFGAFASTLLALAAMVAGIVLAIYAAIDPTGFGNLRLVAAELVAPADRVIASGGSTVGNVGDSLGNWWNAGQQNGQLKSALRVARERAARADGLVTENRELRQLLGLSTGDVPRIATVRILATTPSSTRREAIIDAGFSDGVRAGQPVRSTAGILGRTLQVGPSVARVLLITDRRSVVPARRASDGLPLIVTGRGDEILDVRTLGSATVSLKLNDILLASGSGGIYHQRSPLARIVRITADGALALPLATPAGASLAIVEPSATIDVENLPEPPASEEEAR